MKHFTVKKASMILHNALMGLHQILEIPVHDFIHVPEHDARELYMMVEAMPQTEVGDWYENSWNMFPFAEPSFDNLTPFQQTSVIAVANLICAFTSEYGAVMEE